MCSRGPVVDDGVPVGRVSRLCFFTGGTLRCLALGEVHWTGRFGGTGG